MSKIVRLRSNFTQISNVLLNDKTLSLKAKGLYSFMYSKPNDWNFTIRSMSKQLKEGVDCIAATLKELKVSGWVHHRKDTNGTGEYLIGHSSLLDIEFKDVKSALETPSSTPHTGKPYKPNTDKPYMGKSVPISNTDSYSKKDYSSEKEIFDKFRQNYLGKKRGLDTEFNNFTKKHKDWKDVLLKLEKLNLTLSDFNTEDKKYVPAFAVFINNRQWEYWDGDGTNKVINHTNAQNNIEQAKEREHQEYLKAKAS